MGLWRTCNAVKAECKIVKTDERSVELLPSQRTKVGLLVHPREHLAGQTQGCLSHRAACRTDTPCCPPF